MDPVILAGSESKHIDRKYFQTPPMIPWGGAAPGANHNHPYEPALNMETARPDLAANE